MTRKHVLVLIAGILALFLLSSCSQQTGQSGGSEKEVSSDSGESTPAPTKLAGTAVELEYMTITVIDGWRTMDITDGIQIYKGNEVLQIDLEGINIDETYVKTFIETSVSTHDGTDMVTVTLWGEEFLGTTYQSGSYDQIVYARLFNDTGKMLVVKLAGVKADDIPADIQAMMDSVAFK